MADGLLLVDKPAGITSFQVVARVRRLYGERQVGHAGTLDPMATGLLPVLVGEATKLTPWTMGLSKVYRATVRFGSATDSYDADGRATRQAPPEVLAAVAARADEAVREALPAFTGRIRQRPPAFSALKRDGQRLYDLARKTAAEGGDVEAIPVEEREVEIHELTLEALAFPEAVLLVHCSKGTYIRSLAHDLGAALGCFAHLTALRRLRIGPLDLADAVQLPDRQDAEPPPPLLPLERAVAHLPAVPIDEETTRRLRLGQQAALATLPPIEGDPDAVRLTGPDGALVAILERSPPPHRFRLARVFSPPPTNPVAPEGPLSG